MTKNGKKFLEEIKILLTSAIWISAEATDVNYKIRKKSDGINR